MTVIAILTVLVLTVAVVIGVLRAAGDGGIRVVDADDAHLRVDELRREVERLRQASRGRAWGRRRARSCRPQRPSRRVG